MSAPQIRFRPTLAAALGSLALLTFTSAGLHATAAHASDKSTRASEVRALRASGQILPMEDILSRSRTAQPGEVVEVELERERGRYVYEVKIIDDSDRIHKLEIDAASGEVLRRKLK